MRGLARTLAFDPESTPFHAAFRMNRAPPLPNNNAWIGLVIALAAAIASLYWQKRQPEKPGKAPPATATSANAAPSAGTVTGTGTRP
jgi:hypothetical protein